MRQSWQMWKSQIKSQDCNDLIYRLRELPPMQAQTFNQAGELEENKHRSSIVRWVEDPQIRDMLWWYAQEANRLAFGLDVQNVGSIQFTEYSASQEAHYDWHHDDSNHVIRKLTCIWYLNTLDEDSGGCTEFQCGKKIKPEEGKLLIFPATWNYLHRGQKLLKGEKFIINTFILKDLVKV